MAGRSRWSKRYESWRSMSRRSYGLFLAGVFFTFLPAGLMTDIARLGANGPLRLAATGLFSGGIAVVYVLIVRHWPRLLPVLVVLHVFGPIEFNRIVGPLGPPLAGAALKARLVTDVNTATCSIILGFVLLSQVVRREGTRYVRLNAEIELASEIHRQLVPRIARTIGRFEFHGVSLPSGDVGGDLVDVVETPAGWTSYVADVSGHGVAAGLLMGMLKSTTRTQLRTGERLEGLLNTMNSVLFDLKSPTMFATFAGMQYDGGPTLQFTVAGHLPILHYHAATSAISESTTPQVPIAMFSDQHFATAGMTCGRGDLIVILTDGLTEVFDSADREFGLERLKALIADQATAPLESIERQVFAEVRAHGTQLDDQTLLLIRVLS